MSETLMTLRMTWVPTTKPWVMIRPAEAGYEVVDSLSRKGKKENTARRKGKSESS